VLRKNALTFALLVAIVVLLVLFYSEVGRGYP